MSKFIPAKEYCDKIFDGTHDTPKQVDFGHPLVTSKNIINDKLNLKDTYNISKNEYTIIQKRSAVKQWDILFSMIGTVGEVYLEKNSEIKYAIKNIGVFSCDEVEKAKWLYYYLKSPIAKQVINLKLNGAVQKFLPLGALRNLPVIPYPENQKSFIDFLSSLDAKIELNNRINTELEAMAKALYDYWFVQFDLPDDRGLPYRSSGGRMVWNEELKREVPEGWEVSTFSKWIGHDKSGDWGKESNEGNYSERVYCIRGADINGLNGKGDVKSPERFILQKNKNKILEPFEIIIEISGGSPTQSTGRIAYILEETLKRFDTDIICSNFCKAITLKNCKSLFNFVMEWDKAYDADILFGFEGKTSGIKNLLFESFTNSYKIPIPPREQYEQFFDLILPIKRKIQHGLIENRQLSSLRDWLLPMLMNGQVRVV